MSIPTQPSASTSLWCLAVGESREIVSIEGAKADSAALRLVDIGFRKGQRVTCLMRPGFGAPRVYAVGGATYSLDQQTAICVIVSEESRT